MSRQERCTDSFEYYLGLSLSEQKALSGVRFPSEAHGGKR